DVGTLRTALGGVRAVAFEYVSKPVDIDQVKAVVDRALARRVRAEAPGAPPFPVHDPAPDGLVGRTGGMLAVYKQIALASVAAAPVLVTGETDRESVVEGKSVDLGG